MKAARRFTRPSSKRDSPARRLSIFARAACVNRRGAGRTVGRDGVSSRHGPGDGAIAGEALIRSAPDGYTLLFGTNTGMLAAPTLRKLPPYDPIADFTPISLVGRFGFFLWVHSSVPAKTVQELIAYVRANPGKLNYGTGNSTSIIATAQLAQQQKLDMVHVPYKGDAPVTLDLVAGRIHMVFGTPGTALQHVKEGKLRVLATLLPARSALIPEAPTMPEAGLIGLTITSWAGLFGPAKLPREVADRVARAVQGVLARTEVREQLARYAFEGQSSTPEELGAFVKEQYEVWRKTVQDVGIVRD